MKTFLAMQSQNTEHRGWVVFHQSLDGRLTQLGIYGSRWRAEAVAKLLTVTEGKPGICIEPIEIESNWPKVFALIDSFNPGAKVRVL